jgi:hypothetical protein
MERRADRLETPTKPTILDNRKILANDLSAKSYYARGSGVWTAERAASAPDLTERIRYQKEETNRKRDKCADDQSQRNK